MSCADVLSASGERERDGGVGGCYCGCEGGVHGYCYPDKYRWHCDAPDPDSWIVGVCVEDHCGTGTRAGAGYTLTVTAESATSDVCVVSVGLGGRFAQCVASEAAEDDGIRSWNCWDIKTTGADGSDGSFENRVVGLSHEVRVKAAELAEEMVHPYGRKARLFRKPYGTFAFRAYYTSTLFDASAMLMMRR